MQDWDSRISELKKNIEAARNRFVIPFLDTKSLEEQVVKEAKSKQIANEKSETKVIDKEPEAKDSKIATDEDTKSIQPSQEEVKKEIKEEVGVTETASTEEAEVSEAKEEVKEEKVEEVQKLDTDQADAMLDEVKSETAPTEEAEVSEAKEEVEEKPKKGRRKKIKEVKPDILAAELSELEAIKEEDLTEEQEDRLMELRRIKTQRLMHQEVDEQFQSEMKQADDEIKTLKNQLKIKDPLPKGYVEWFY